MTLATAAQSSDVDLCRRRLVRRQCRDSGAAQPCHVAGHQRLRRRPLVRGRGARSRPAMPHRVNSSAIALGLKPTMTHRGNRRPDLGRAEEVRWQDGGLYPPDVLGRAWRLHGRAGRSGVDALLPLPLRIADDRRRQAFRLPCRRSAARPSKRCRPTPRPAASIPTMAVRSSKPRCAASTMRWCSTCWATSPRRDHPISSWSRTAMSSRRPPNGTFLSGITRARTIVAAGGLWFQDDGKDAVGARFPGSRRDLFDRKPFQGGADDAHRGSPSAARAGGQEGARALLGMGAFDVAWPADAGLKGTLPHRAGVVRATVADLS